MTVNWRSLARVGLGGLLAVVSLSVFAGDLSTHCPNIESDSGECLRVNQHSIYVEQHRGKGPSVVFESGRGDTHSSWDKVVPIVAKFASTVTYDRPGLGFSQPDGEPATAEAIASNLKSMLVRAQVKPPYLLVGHSDGGLFVQMLARRYPKLVSAVILVDSASEYQTITSLPLKKSNPHYQEIKGESDAFEVTKRELRHAPAFPAVPLIVLTATWHFSPDPNFTSKLLYRGKPHVMTEHENQQIWYRLQNKMVGLSPNSMHWYAYGSGHHIQKYQPELVADAVYTLLQSLRNHDKKES